MNLRDSKIKVRNMRDSFMAMAEKHGSVEESAVLQRMFSFLENIPDELEDDEVGKVAKLVIDELAGFWDGFVSSWKIFYTDMSTLTVALEEGKIDRAEFERVLEWLKPERYSGIVYPKRS